MTGYVRRRARGSALGLWVGYLPLVVVAAWITAMVVLLPSERPDGSVAADGNGGGNGAPVEGVGSGETATGWGESVQLCTDRQVQVVDDGYSPPCFTFTGDNGAETTRGVSADTIKVAYRRSQGVTLFEVLALATGYPWDENIDDLIRTADGLVDYFNQNFQMYGRQIELVEVEGFGDLLQELTSSGVEEARNDATKVADDVGAFADISALSQPYAEALSSVEVVNIGAPYMSRQWFADRAPYAWSTFPNCGVAAETASAVGTELLLGQPAMFAQGDLQDRERSVGLVVPENREWQQCADDSVRVIEDAGFQFGTRQSYILNPAELQSAAVSVLQRLKADGVTSVACACDPVFLTYLTQQATAQDYHPEWFVMGVGFVDMDLVGQMIALNSPEQWSRSFGGSLMAAPPDPGSSEGYLAYRTVREDEPSKLVDLVYFQLYQLAIGIQMAGPNLTPETFQDGMFRYPGGTGGWGLWRFTPENPTGVSDARVVWWDGDGVSPFNGQPGTYRDNGQRYEDIGEVDPSTLGLFVE